jgi:PAS domain-containing protein
VARLTESAEAVAGGDLSRRTGILSRNDELGRLGRAFDSMVERVQESFDARREAEAYYRDLFESVPLATWLYDPETLAILEVNDAAIRLYGYDRAEFLALSVRICGPPKTCQCCASTSRRRRPWTFTGASGDTARRTEPSSKSKRTPGR